MIDTSVLDLRDLTLDEALAALIAGVPLARAGEMPFVLDEASRAALQFYAARRRYWEDGAKNTGMQEVLELLAWMDQPRAAYSRPAPRGGGSRGVLDLVRVEIHHWGGLHAHCVEAGGLPDPLVQDLDGDLTLVFGRNGAGKTSLANAIRWALTGQVADSQGPPRVEPAPAAPRYSDESQEASSFTLPSIVPVPSKGELAALRGAPVVATRVVLTFRRPDGASIVVERRVTPEGRTRFTATTLPTGGPALALGVSDRTVEVSTLIFSLLPHLNLPKRNPLGESVAALTGLQPLEELGRRSAITAKYLRKQATVQFKKEQSSAAVRCS